MNKFLRRFFVKMDQAAGGDGGGAGGGATAAAAPEPSFLESALATPAAAPAVADPAASAAPLTPEAQSLKASETDTRRPAHIPAKFWNAEKGEINHEAWAGSYKGLESRMRDIGLPPKDASEYQYQPPAGMEELEMDPDLSATFKAAALEHGLTNKQYQFVMDQYVKQIPALVEGSMTYGKEAAGKALTEFYKTPEALTENVRYAFQAFDAYADEADRAELNRIGNIPAVVKILAKVGRELQADPGVGGDAILPAESIDELMGKGSPYWDPQHPKHAAIKAKVAKHHEAVVAAKNRRM